MPFGTLRTKEVCAIPAHSPPYPSNTIEYSDVEILSVKYVTSADALKEFVPEELEIEEEPVVSYSLCNWGFSSMGAYTEFISLVEVTFKGAKYDYALEFILDNEAAIFLGREQYGFPKVVGKVVFDRYSTSPAPNGFLLGHVERPAGTKIIQFGFKPQVKVHGVQQLRGPEKKLLCLRIIPSPIIGNPPVLREFVAFKSVVSEGELWTGAGSLGFSGLSCFDVATKLPVLRYVGATFLTKGASSISPEAEIFAI